MKKIYFSIFLNFSIISAFTQQQVFTKVFYHNLYDVTAGGIIKTPDHHFLIYGNYLWYPLIIKMDTVGNIVWSKVFTNVYAPFRAIAPTHDSCFIVVTEGMFVSKITQDCDTIWTRLVDLGSGYCYQPSVQETSDFGIILSGTMYDTDKTEISVAAIKMNDSGEIEWSKKITNSGNSTYVSRIKQTIGGGFILFGSMRTLNPYYFIEPYLLKLSSNGDFEWAKTLISTNFQYGEAIDFVDVDDGLALLTNINDFATIIKTDFNGSFVWGRKINTFLGIEFYSNSYPKLNKTSGSDLIFACGWGDLIKLDITGNKEWSRYIDLYSLEVIESDDGGFMVVGNGPLMGVKSETYNPQIGIIKTDSIGNSSDCVWGGSSNAIDIVPDIQAFTLNVEQLNGTISCPGTSVVDTAIYTDPGCVAFIGGVNENPSAPIILSIFPNPSNGIFQVGINKQDINGFTSLAIYNIMGEKVFETTDPLILASAIDLRAQPDGVYFVRCLVGENVLSEKIVISDK